MTKKYIIILCSLALLICFVLIGKKYFSLKLLQRPELREGIVKIEVYEGRYEILSRDPDLVLLPDSSVGLELIKEIENSWRKDNVLKFHVDYVIGITYSDGSVDYVSVGESFISIKTMYTDGKGVYKQAKDLNGFIKSLLDNGL